MKYGNVIANFLENILVIPHCEPHMEIIMDYWSYKIYTYLCLFSHIAILCTESENPPLTLKFLRPGI